MINKFLKKIFFLSILNFCYVICYQKKADLVIYSFNRPMQLYALLESVEKFVKNLGEVNIIYRTNNNDYSNAYLKVIERFKIYKFNKQNDKNPSLDFKPLVMNCAFNTPNEYIFFAVDDIIVKDHLNISQCIETLEATNNYAFYLRLGKNINKCFMMKTNSPVPPYLQITNNICSWTFKTGSGDWNFPNNNDMTIYRKADVKWIFERINFNDTNYEGIWASYSDSNKKGLFFEQSKIVNVSINLVNEEPNLGQFTQEWKKKMNLYSTKELLKKFNENKKIDISVFHKINNESPHIEYEISFIDR